jgi:HEAT repeat protein
VEDLCGLVNDPDHDVRESAIAALGQIGDRRAIVPLVPALMDEESSVRSAAAAALHKLDRHWAQQEDVRQVEPKIINALKHPDYWVRHSAGKLLELLKVDPDRLPSAPAAAPEKMTREAPPHPAASALADLLFDRDRDLRLAAAAALGRLRDKSAGSVLTAALRDTDSSVRQAAQAALAALN